MSITMYSASVPVLVRALENLQHVLKKGEAHAEAKKISPEVLLHTRLTPDMFPLVRQVQIATDIAKGGAARLAGADPMKMEDNEASFADLYARIDKVIAYINSFTAAQIDGSETREILLPQRSGEPLTFTGEFYLLGFVLPNVHFHATTAYAILRGAGVDIGKKDYLGKP
ncbi:MAG TPA: DUF1993 domain-containing protein [Luteibacter sp.]|jgi:hypothetical protein|nr:DUF1993 domain-containing protein [Luteibacter sp.]